MAKRQRSIRRADGNEYHEESDISSQINIAEHESWYRPKMNRVESDAYLLNTPPGAFIVRMSSKGGADSYFMVVLCFPKKNISMIHFNISLLKFHLLF